MEDINTYLGITNTVSVPALIALIIFITGVMITYMRKRYDAFVSKKNTRKTFRKLIERTIIEIKLKEKHLKQLIDTLHIDHRGNWEITHVNLTYLDTFFDFNYIDIFIAFNDKFSFCSRKKSLHENAFHKTWSLIRRLRFIEKPSLNSLEIMIDKFNNHKDSYNDRLESYRLQFIKETTPIRDPKIDRTPEEFHSKLNRVYSDYKLKDSKYSTHLNTTYKDIVNPSMEICKQYAKSQESWSFNSILSQATNEYMEMEHLVNACRKQYCNYYHDYGISRRLLEKILKILKK